jgi:type I restriction enzyme R subunit
MPEPGEHKTVQARILKYAEEIGWTFVLHAEAEARRSFDPDGVTPEDRARTVSSKMPQAMAEMDSKS